MKTNRIFIGDIYIGDVLFKKNATLIYYKGRGYIDYESIIGSFVNLRVFLGKMDKLFMGTTIDLKDKYIKRETLRPCEYDNISSLKNVSREELALILDNESIKKSNLF